MTWKGPATIPPPEVDYIQIYPPQKTRDQIAAERRAAKLASWPCNVDITCPECGMVFRLVPGSANYTMRGHICYARCPNCPPTGTFNITIAEPREPSWWQRLWGRRADG